MESKDKDNSNLSLVSRFKKRHLKEEEASDNSETNEESNMTLSELRVKLNEENMSVQEWKSKLEDDTLLKTLSPSAMSSDASSVHSARFDTEFSVGQRIEVKDYRTDTWYTAKIVEVDYDDREVFIHYERWSQRFDEWLKWDSQRIRKIRLPPSHHKFKVGERVLATWSYTKKYPAVVKSVLQDDKYEVLFYDGFAKILKGNRITKIDPRQVDLIEKMPKEIPRAPPIGADLDVRNIGTKEERRQKKRRLNVVELLQSGKRRRVDEILSSQSCSDTSPEISSRRRRRQRQPTNSHNQSSSFPASNKIGNNRDTIFKSKNNLVKIEKEKESLSKESNVKTDNDSKNQVEGKSDNSVNNADVKLENISETEVDEKEDKIKSDLTTVSMIDEVSNIEKDKDSNSEQEFTGFDTSALIIKPDDYHSATSGYQRSSNTQTGRSVNKDNISASPSLSTVRRISKRGRIPKLKTSFGGITSAAPRLSSFPKIKPRGRIYKTDLNTNRNKGGGSNKIKNRSKLIPSSVADVDNVNPPPSSSSSSSPPSSLPPIIRTDQMLQRPAADSVVGELVNDNNEVVSREHHEVSSDTSNLNTKESNFGLSNNNGSLNNVSSDNNNLENIFMRDSFSSTNSGDSIKKKGRRLKKSLKKLDAKKSNKSWKIVTRRKADDDDDPERWNGGIPEGAKPVFIDGGDGKMRQSIIIPDKKLPPGWTKHTIIRKNSSKWDVLLVNPNGRKFRSRKDLRTYYSEMNKDYPEDCFDFVVGRTKATSSLIEMETMAKKQQGLSPPSLKTPNRKKDSRKSGSDDSFCSLSPSHNMVIHDGEKRVKTLMPKTKPPAISEDELIVSASAAVAAVSAVTTNANVSGSTGNTQQLLSAHSINKTMTVMPLTPKLSADVTPIAGISGVSTPDADGTASWLCPKDICGKHFRKENLLQMHIKHYHPEYNQFLDSAPNVADLAYARTVGEPLDETVGAASFLDRINKYEARRKAKADVGGSFSKKPAVINSPLRKALLKGLPSSKDGLEQIDDIDFISKIEQSQGTLQGRRLDVIGEQGDTVDGISERTEFADKGRMPSGVDDNDCDFTTGSGGHSTLKELLSGGGGSFEESAPNSPATPTGVVKNTATNKAYRFSLNKPLLSLEKLNVTTDSNDSATDIADQELSADVSNCTEAEHDDLLKKEEIINCSCGFAEEDGLMIQCDLCLCWQHGFCNEIRKESDVPEKYICGICKNPKKLRNSYKYTYNFDWLKEGKLPVLSFRNKDRAEIEQRESLLKRSHDLVSSLLQLQKVVKSLRLKTHIAGKSDHPKLYLWAKSWEKLSKQDNNRIKTEDTEADVKDENCVKEEENKKDDIKKEKQLTDEDSTPKGPQAPVPEAPIDLVECRLQLLEHIEDYQQQVDSRLTSLEAQIVALESQDPDLASDETPDYYPQTKQTVQMLMRDLTTVRKVIGLN
ncbi:uncharacterized protein LOC142333451 isoform X2 [Lycorma delicatula]|uniref:uncharacterized protein LOC142333451 isoform X2 n=1 Tax=Lycorma delicatula TaxID=130591 RepID=UPI003F516548